LRAEALRVLRARRTHAIIVACCAKAGATGTVALVDINAKVARQLRANVHRELACRCSHILEERRIGQTERAIRTRQERAVRHKDRRRVLQRHRVVSIRNNRQSILTRRIQRSLTRQLRVTHTQGERASLSVQAFHKDVILTTNLSADDCVSTVHTVLRRVHCGRVGFTARGGACARGNLDDTRVGGDGDTAGVDANLRTGASETIPQAWRLTKNTRHR